MCGGGGRHRKPMPAKSSDIRHWLWEARKNSWKSKDIANSLLYQQFILLCISGQGVPLPAFTLSYDAEGENSNYNDEWNGIRKALNRGVPCSGCWWHHWHSHVECGRREACWGSSRLLSHEPCCPLATAQCIRSTVQAAIRHRCPQCFLKMRAGGDWLFWGGDSRISGGWVGIATPCLVRISSSFKVPFMR